jgi:hypothetical protein
MQFYSSNSIRIPNWLASKGQLTEIFNSDGTNYGGSGVLNADKIS